MGIISIVILIFTAVIALLCGLKGYFSGALKQGIRFGTLVLAIIGSIFVTKAVYSAVISSFEGMSAQEIMAFFNDAIPIFSDETLSWFANVEADSVLYVLAIPFGIIILPIVFIPIFLVINGLSMIITAIVCKVTGINKRKKTLGLRLGGMAIGLFQGIVISAMVLLPVAGLSPYVEDTANIIKSSSFVDETKEEVVCAYDEYVAPITESVPVKMLTFFGGSIVYDFVATVEVDGESVNTTTLIPDTAAIYSEILKCEGMDWKHLTDSQERSVRAMVSIFKNNEYLTVVSADIVRAFSSSVVSGEFNLETEEELRGIMTEFFSVFTETTSETVGEDLDTFTEVYLTLSRDGFFVAMEADESSDEMLKILTKEENGKTIITKVVEILRGNKRTEKLVGMLTKLSLTIMADNLEMGEDAVKIYDNVKGGINDALSIEKEGKTEEEYLGELSESLDNTLRDNGIEIEKEIVDEMADFVSQNFEAGTVLTDDQINDIILSYYDAYLQYVAKDAPEDNPTA